MGMTTIQKMGEATSPHGFVHWEVEDANGKVVRRGDGN